MKRSTSVRGNEQATKKPKQEQGEQEEQEENQEKEQEKNQEKEQEKEKKGEEKKGEEKKGEEKKGQEKLSDEQLLALRAAKQGKNLFISGPAGTGKSFVTERVVRELRDAGRRVVVTATTGIAAFLVGGSTLYSTFSFHPKMVEASSFKKNKRWAQVDTLVVDEISMCDAALFGYIDRQARMSRGSDDPFGGVQVVLVGDFYQLPPVQGTFVFNSQVFKTLFAEGRRRAGRPEDRGAGQQPRRVHYADGHAR
jgi:ATP-dependent DNA helicase PIF1